VDESLLPKPEPTRVKLEAKRLVYHIDVILPRSSVTSARPVSTAVPLVSEASVPIIVEAIPV